MGVLEYLIQKQEELKRIYPEILVDRTDPFQFLDAEVSIKHPGFSLDLAIEVGRKLLEEGKIPYIIAFIEQIHKDEIEGEYRKFSPLIYQGKVTWYYHHVCCSGDKAYDSFIGIPVSIEHYSELAFGEKIAFSIDCDVDEIVRIIASKKFDHSMQNFKDIHNPASMKFQRKFQIQVPIISGEGYQILSNKGIIETFDYRKLSN